MSQVQIQPGGSATPSLATVCTDQDTIVGAGTPQDPLRTGSGGNSFQATYFGVGAPVLGSPVCESSGSVSVGVTSVTLAQAHGTRSAATCVGIVTAYNADTGSTTVQYDGIVTLTAAEWDVIAGTTGGLTRSETYYLDTQGALIDTPAAGSGSFIAQVLTALNGTQALLSLPTQPQEIP